MYFFTYNFICIGNQNQKLIRKTPRKCFYSNNRGKIHKKQLRLGTRIPLTNNLKISDWQLQ